MELAQVRVVPTDAGWQVQVGNGLTRPVDGLVPLAALAGLGSLPEARSASRLLSPGSDAAFTRVEDEIGQRLGRALAEAGAAWDHLQQLLGRADALGAPLVVVLDAEDPEVRALPWELLALGDGPLETAARGVVVRWSAGSPTLGEPSATFSVWVAGADPIAERVAADARQAMNEAGLRSDDDQPALLWLVAHGERGADALEIATEDGAGSTAALAARLGPKLRAARVVVLGVCHGGAAELHRRDVLVGRLLAAGVPAVVASSHAVPADLLARLARGMAGSLGRGEALHAVIAAGRREVRAWAFPHPLARWSRIQAYVSSVVALDQVLRPTGWVPDRWPAPDGAAASWLAEAHRDAIRRGDGYVGVEHLLRVLQRMDGGGAAASAARRGTPLLLQAYDEVCAALSPQEGDPAEVGVTPRLARVGAALRPGFGVDELAHLLIGSPAAPQSTETWDTTDQPGGPVGALEVFGGPEDGRVLVLRPGGEIGRAGGGCALELFVGTRLTDRRLSRRHLVWDGRRLVGVKPVRVSGHDGVRDPADPLRIGDLVQVTPGTRLRALP